jgi:two-component system, OmpR family, alkaline phosphatase synthesis response regulator PhoP
MNGPHEPPFVLVAHGDGAELATLRTTIRLAGAQVASCRTVSVALEAVTFHLPSVLVVDVSMEDGKGWEIVHAAAGAGHLPLIALDRTSDLRIRRAAFAAGADEVIALPADPDDLATRVMALAGRARRSTGFTPLYRHRGLVLDVAAHAARLHGRPVTLTPQQFAILRALFEANGATLPRARLLARIEALDDEPPSERAIDLHVTRLRKRLGDDAKEPRFIEAVYGVGYRLATDADLPEPLGDQAEDVLAALPAPVLVIDEQLRVRFANEALARLIALPRAEIVGRQCGDVLGCHDECGATLAGPRCLARAFRSGETALRDVPVRVRIGGERLEVAYSIAEVPGDGLLTIQIRPR